MIPSSIRLDLALVRRGLTRSRTEAQALIAAGQVSVAGQSAAKPRLLVSDTDPIEIWGERCPFVSRAGLKLSAALDTFAISAAHATALDIGASTGGFSDCLLQHGAARVEAIDVGHGQLAPSLATEPRLHYREGINARFISPADFDTLFDIIVVDVSFISLTLILPALPPLLKAAGQVVCLVKPQFETGREGLDKHGIVRDPGARLAALNRVRGRAQKIGLQERGMRESPLLGADGNHEFLLWLTPHAGEDALSGE